MSRTTRRRVATSAAVLALGAVALALTALPRCSDTAHFQHDAAPPDGTPWIYDGTQPVPDSYINPCAPDPPPRITGKVYAPNGTDPVAGAAVYVPLGILPIPQSVYCKTCVVQGKFKAHTYSKADGSFVLDKIPHGTYKIGIEKGQFRRILQLTVPRCGTVKLTAAQSTLPGKNKQWSPFDTIPTIGVITGAWDKMEKVLDKLGVQEKKIYNGRDYGTGPDSMQALLQNGARLRSHHILLINCGTKFEALVTSPGPARNNIREYVRQGGRLLTTDFSYDYIEQVFPEFIDFEGSESTAKTAPEEHNAAELGTGNIQVAAEVKVPELKAWLGLAEIQALRSDGRVDISGLKTGWAVQKAVDSKLPTTVWVTGPVKWIGGTGQRPLTTSFDFLDSDAKGCGRVMFSSYHTYGSAATLLPQERILEYLILEIGTCIDIK